MYYIGIDLGTSAVKLLLMEESGKICNIVSREYPLFFPHPGWSEQKPEDWFAQSMEGMKELTKRSNMKKMPKNLPLLFVSGEKDPVGGFGKDVKKVYESYLKAGMKNAEIRLYENDRHEILNEQDRRVVYEELYQWMERNLSG